MIPTRFKAKLPKGLSYPLGAEAISQTLAGAPHADELHLSFYGQAVWPAAEFNRLLREGLPYRILSAEYTPPLMPRRIAPKRLVEVGRDQGSWYLTVYPLLCELRPAANHLLREQGLPAVTEWLRSSERSGWDSQQHRIDLVFSPADDKLVVAREDGV
jgi:hypothetical protein